MDRTLELKQERLELIQKMKGILDLCDDEKRSMTGAESEQYKRWDSRIDRIDQEVIKLEEDAERRRRIAEREVEARTGIKGGNLDVDPEKEFRNVGEFFFSLARKKRDNISDPRLDKLYEQHEQREQTMGTGATGGYALPSQFDSTMRQVQAAEAAIRPRAAVLPAGTPPDAKLSFPTLDQTAAQNIYGGVIITHTGEGVTMTETDTKLREMTLEPKEISAYIVVTNKLLTNWTAASSFITRVLSQAVAGAEDLDFISGNGVNKSTGFLNSAAAIPYTRAAANQIAFADVYNMLARVLMRGGQYVWLGSQTIIPQLAAMVDAGNHAVWLGSTTTTGNAQGAAGPLPSTLMGLPMIFNDRMPGLGTKGDLSLVNLSYYLIKDGSGPFVASSEHIYFLSNKTVFKIVWNVDGKPWLTEPIALEGSTSDTVSPFVILN